MPPASAWGERAAAVRQARSVAAIANTIIHRWLTPPYAEEHRGVANQLRSMLVSTPAEGYASCCDAIRHTDLRGVLGTIRAPTLVIAGKLDLAAPPAKHAQVIAQGISGARLELVNAAHLANVEQPTVVTKLALDHLRPEP
jgi:3-oxoadipate enol-lactonase